MSTNPSVSLSSRPTGNRDSRRSGGGSRSSTVLSRGSWVEETTPAGLCSIRYTYFSVAMGWPSTVTAVPGATLSSGPRGAAPATLTRPALIRALASFRDHCPVAASSLSSRSIVSPFPRRDGGPVRFVPCCIVFFPQT